MRIPFTKIATVISALTALAASRAVAQESWADLSFGDTATVFLHGRLEGFLPETSRIEPRRMSLMAGVESEEEETRVVCDLGQKRLVLMIYESFRRCDGNLLESVRVSTFARPRAGESPPTVERLSAAAPGISIVSLRPAQRDLEAEAILLEQALVALPDGTILDLRFYVNREGAKDLDAALLLSRKLLNGLAPGGRELSLQARTQRLPADGRELLLDLPAEVAMTAQQGPDFEVYRFWHVGAFLSNPGHLGVYIGAHPAYQYVQRQRHLGEGWEPEIETLAIELLGSQVEWQLWQDVSGRHFAELIVPLPGSQHGQLHFFASGPDRESLQTMQAIVASARLP